MSNSQMQDFIPAAAGLQAGTQGEAVERLQAFLGKFGYLNPRLPDAPEPTARSWISVY